MLVAADLLNKGPGRPLAAELLQRRRAPQKLREDDQYLADALHQTLVSVFGSDDLPLILPPCQDLGNAGPYLLRDPLDVSHALKYKPIYQIPVSAKPPATPVRIYLDNAKMLENERQKEV